MAAGIQLQTRTCLIT